MRATASHRCPDPAYTVDERDIRETERRKSTELLGAPLSASTASLPLSDVDDPEVPTPPPQP